MRHAGGVGRRQRGMREQRVHAVHKGGGGGEALHQVREALRVWDRRAVRKADNEAVDGGSGVARVRGGHGGARKVRAQEETGDRIRGKWAGGAREGAREFLGGRWNETHSK